MKISSLSLSNPANLQGTPDGKAEAELNERSFIHARGGVVVRASDQCVNHLYTDPTGKVHEAVVGFNQKTWEITVSFARPFDEGKTTEDILRLLHGEDELDGGSWPVGLRQEIVEVAEKTRTAIRALCFVWLSENGFQRHSGSCLVEGEQL